MMGVYDKSVVITKFNNYGGKFLAHLGFNE